MPKYAKCGWTRTSNVRYFKGQTMLHCLDIHIQFSHSIGGRNTQFSMLHCLDFDIQFFESSLIGDLQKGPIFPVTKNRSCQIFCKSSTNSILRVATNWMSRWLPFPWQTPFYILDLVWWWNQLYWYNNEITNLQKDKNTKSTLKVQDEDEGN